MRWIYLSPHFDDAVLSCGGLIWEQARKGIPVEIWTVCAGDAPAGPLSIQAQYCHAVWGTGDAARTVAVRTEEDQNAADLLGAQTVRFSIPDCIYRRDESGELTYPDAINGTPAPAEAGLETDIAAALATELEPDDLLVCPLTLGLHVDHVIARRAAERLGRPLLYYADIPYLFRKPETLAPATEGMDASLQPVPEAGLSAWQNGIAAYQSQMIMLFTSDEQIQRAIQSGEELQVRQAALREGEEQMRGVIRREWESRGGIRLWKPRS